VHFDSFEDFASRSLGINVINESTTVTWNSTSSLVSLACQVIRENASHPICNLDLHHRSSPLEQSGNIPNLSPDSIHSENPAFNTVPTSVGGADHSDENYSKLDMAYRFVDPRPFMPRGAQRVMVPGRKHMRRVLMGRPHSKNNDLAIVTIDPLPQAQVSFQNIRGVIADFLADQARVGYNTIQPCPYGQAYVRFNFFHDRDFFILNSPHQFGDIRISFTEHNKGSNNRRLEMNYEVWLMLLGHNVDYWS
jgi:hypothetical protein